MTDFKELREGDGYMPVLLTSAASIAVILKKLSKLFLCVLKNVENSETIVFCSKMNGKEWGK